MKRKILQLFLQTATLSIFFFVSCRKQEKIYINKEAESFFELDASSPSVLSRIADTIRKQNEHQNFLSRVIKEEGLPQWKQADIIINSSVQGYDNNKDTSVIIPMILKDTKYVNSMLICSVSEDSIRFNLVQGRYYYMYGFENKKNTMNADLVSALLMYYDNKLFNYTEFSVFDTRLFESKTSLSVRERIDNTSSITVSPPKNPPIVFVPDPTACISIILLGINGSASGEITPGCIPIIITVSDPIMPTTTVPGGSSYYGSAGSSGGTSASSSTWPNGACTNNNPSTPPPPGYVYPPSCSNVISVAPATPVNLYDPTRPFSDLNSPINVPDGPYLYNGISVSDIPPGTPQGTPRLIGTTRNRGNTEDLTYGTNGDAIGIIEKEKTKSNDDLFIGMNRLFDRCTVLDNSLNAVGKEMIQKFKTNTSNKSEFTNYVLTKKVQESAAMINFLKDFGNRLRTSLAMANGNINNVQAINMGNTHPTFGTLYHKFHGLQILINDTELTEIQLDRFYVSPTKTWEADITVTMYDHFGLDKSDAINYQIYDFGFADWWLLQHSRGFVPFVTKISFKKRLSGSL